MHQHLDMRCQLHVLLQVIRRNACIWHVLWVAGLIEEYFRVVVEGIVF
jgi:hypothetical protein